MNRRSLIAGAALAGVWPLSVGAACDASDEANAETMRRYVTEVLNGGDLSVIDQIGHPEYSSMDPDDSPGLEAWKQRIAASRQMVGGFVPDVTYVIEELIAADQRVAMRARLTGNSTSGKVVDVLMLAIVEFRDGKLYKVWDLEDTDAFVAAL